MTLTGKHVKFEEMLKGIVCSTGSSTFLCNLGLPRAEQSVTENGMGKFFLLNRKEFVIAQTGSPM